MGVTTECLYCVSEITDGFRFNGETDMRVWEKSLALSLCDAGASPIKIGAILLELRFIIFLFNVSKLLGMRPGDCITNPEVIAFVQYLFDKKMSVEDVAKRAKSQFPLFPWKTLETAQSSGFPEGSQDFSL